MFEDLLIMSHLKNIFSLFIIYFFILIGINTSQAIPLDTDAVSLSQPEIIAAENAFNIGLFNVAQRLYFQLLEKTTNPSEIQSLSIQLAFTLINQSKYGEALEVLNKIPNKADPTLQLLISISTFPTNPDLSKKIIEKLSPKSLPKGYLAWYYIIQGLIAEYNENFKEAKNYFLEARSLANSDALINHIDTLLFRSEIFSKKINEGLAFSLEKKIEKGKKNSYPLIKQYAIVLDKLGKKDKAISFLQSALTSIPFKDANEIDSIYLLIGIIATPQSEPGRRAFEKIIERKQNTELSKIALTFLSQSVNDDNASSYMKFLTSLINASQKHPLIDHLLLHRAHLALALHQRDISEKDLLHLQDDYPGSSNISEAMRLLAYIEWTNIPPHYRTAADILIKLVEKTKDLNEQAELTLLAADAYFLNQDYGLASKIYSSILDNPEHQLPKGPVLAQLTLSLVNEKDLKTAELYLNKFRNDPDIDSIYLWRAEWSLINAMKNQGQIPLAFSQIHKLLQSTASDQIPLDLRLRLIWLRAQLSFESGNPQDTPPIIDSLLNNLQSTKTESLNPDQSALIASHALLLKAQALFQLNKENQALATITTLRETYPQSKATLLSYLTEAHYYSSINNPNKAQQELINLADNFPNNEYTAIALYEAALNAESRSLKNTYQEALALLERLISSYPNSPFTYNARFKQADILRKLGNFSDAQLLYENLLKQYPNHPEKYKTKLASIDSLSAQTTNSPSFLPEVASQYYSILDLPTLSPTLRAEAGFKSGFTYIKANQPLKAQDTFWLTINTLLLDPAIHKDLNEQSRYWIARSIFELGSLLEKSNQFKEANEVYNLILSHHLPGSALAESKLK